MDKGKDAMTPPAAATLPAPFRNAPITTGSERHGGAGMCAACGDWIINHFDPQQPRVFIGCNNPDVTDETVFMMVPMTMVAPIGVLQQQQQQRHINGINTEKRRQFQVAVHHFKMPEGKTIKDIVRPGTAKEKVVKFLQKSSDGVLARDIITATKLTHGDVQQALRWLRDHGIVQSVEAAK